jgi:hypothetical protein
MTAVPVEQWSTRTVSIRGSEIPVWPEDQKISKLHKSLVLMTRFTDVLRYHTELTRKILALENESRFMADYAPGGCGIKIYHLDRWQSAIAMLIHQRAPAFFSKVFNCPDPLRMSPWRISSETGNTACRAAISGPAQAWYTAWHVVIRTRGTPAAGTCALPIRA